MESMANNTEYLWQVQRKNKVLQLWSTKRLVSSFHHIRVPNLHLIHSIFGFYRRYTILPYNSRVQITMYLGAKKRLGVLMQPYERPNKSAVTKNYRISSYIFRPFIVSTHFCPVTFGLMYCDLGFPNSKKNSFCGNYMRKYGM